MVKRIAIARSPVRAPSPPLLARFARLSILALLSIAAGCGEETVVRPARERGEHLFRDPDFSRSQFNIFSCSDCHATNATDDSLLRLAGNPLNDSAFRAAWWNGYTAQYLDAVNACWVFFMRGEAQGVVAGDPEGDALYEYLVSISPGNPAPALPLTYQRNIIGLVPGIAVNGEQVYDMACRNCHGDAGTGRGRLHASIVALGPELSASYDAEFPGIDHDVLVVEKVRHGQFFGVGGNMPPFALERLSDAELADLLAFLDL